MTSGREHQTSKKVVDSTNDSDLLGLFHQNSKQIKTKLQNDMNSLKNVDMSFPPNDASYKYNQFFYIKNWCEQGIWKNRF